MSSDKTLEKMVMIRLEDCWVEDDENGWRNMARYALDLAMRAVDDYATHRGTPRASICRAVMEGGKDAGPWAKED